MKQLLNLTLYEMTGIEIANSRTFKYKNVLPEWTFGDKNVITPSEQYFQFFYPEGMNEEDKNKKYLVFDISADNVLQEIILQQGLEETVELMMLGEFIEYFTFPEEIEKQIDECYKEWVREQLDSCCDIVEEESVEGKTT